MKEALLDWLLCPYCGNDKLRIVTNGSGRAEIREGKLVCESCRGERPVKEGIPDLLLDTELAKEYMPRKQSSGEGGEAAVHQQDMDTASVARVGRREDLDRGWVLNTEMDFDWLFPHLRASRGLKVLEIGAGTCWATARFAKAGCQCVAVDILVKRKLECADYWFAQDGIYFERVLCSMERLHFRSALFDIVFSCSTLMYGKELLKVLEEIRRVLRPNGRLILCSEPVVGIFQFGTRRTWHLRDSGHVYTLLQWKKALREAGFGELKVSFPHSVCAKLSDPSKIIDRGSPHFLLAKAISPFWRIGSVRRLVVNRLAEPWLFLTPVSSPLVAIARRTG